MDKNNGFSLFRIGVFQYFVLFLWSIVFVILYSVGKCNYLLFHVTVELLSVVVATAIFMFAWNTGEYLANSYYKVIGISFLFVGCLDFMHTITYEGMAILPQTGAPHATQLWIAARYMQAISFLVAPLILNRDVNMRKLFFVYTAVTILILISIFYWDIFPACYVYDVGLTAFKKSSEYLICVMFAGSIALLYAKRAVFDRRIMKLMLFSLAITILSELAFTNYIGVYGDFNVLGHILKLIAVYCIYRGIIEKGLRKPYNILLRDLKQHEIEQQRLLDELSTKNNELIRANQELDTFVHITTHDLKSPLRSFSGFLGMLKESAGSKLNEEELFFIGRLNDALTHMQEIVENLLTLSKMSRTKNTLDNVDAGKMFKSIADQLCFEIAEHSVDVRIEQNIPCIVTDRLKIKEVFLNLFTNAVKFSSKVEGRTPCVEIGYIQEDGNHIVFVKDNGIGIEKQYQQKIFDCFSRLHTQREYKGTGIGLHIVKVVVENLGGEVRLESTFGKGTTFYVVLPMNPDNTTAS